MMEPMRTRNRTNVAAPATAMLIALAAAWPAGTQAAPGIEIGSVLAVDVWQHPELSREIEVAADGRTEFPPVGELRAEGVAPSALAERIADGLAAFVRETPYVTVREVYPVTVNGFVARPGRVVMDRTPTLVEAILQAGGPIAGAWLDRVIIYRQGQPSEIIMASVADAFGRGQSTGSPELRRNDLVFVRGESPGTGGIPGMAGGGAGAGGGAASSGGGSSGMGQGLVALEGVTGPGLYGFPPGADLYTGLGLAHGPSAGANLGRTRVISRQGDGRVVYEVNLARSGSQALPRTFPLRDGDVVQVGVDRRGMGSRLWNGTRSALIFARDFSSAYLLYRTVKR
jgi:protein involved in polysaccharide export with SLBB domain